MNGLVKRSQPSAFHCPQKQSTFIVAGTHHRSLGPQATHPLMYEGHPEATPAPILPVYPSNWKMKIVLAGSTGFIGQEVLQQCLDSSKITSVVVLSRRELPSQEDKHKAKKLRVVLVDDFLWYPDSVRDVIKNADACIW